MMICPTCGDMLTANVTIDENVLEDLAAAIRRGDMADAEYHLDRIADLGGILRHRVEIARYSPRAKAA